MAYDKEIRFKCRALYEVLDMTLSEISEKENVPVATLSDWKNDDREIYGGIWIKGVKAENIAEATKKLRDELQATSVYDEMKKNVTQFYGVNDKGAIDIGGILDVGSSNAQLQASIDADVIMLACVNADWFDTQLFKNSMLSSVLLSNQAKKDVTKIRQSDIKQSSEIHKIAKEARFGKSPETIIFNNNGDYTTEDLANMSFEQLEQLMKQEKKKALLEMEVTK
jgi:hypothetical protein